MSKPEIMCEVLEDPGFQHDGVNYLKGNTYPFPENVADAYCTAGMLKALGGEFQTGERQVRGSVTIEVKGASQQTNATEPN